MLPVEQASSLWIDGFLAVIAEHIGKMVMYQCVVGWEIGNGGYDGLSIWLLHRLSGTIAVLSL